MSLPNYCFLSETTLRERAQNPKKFEEELAQLERSSVEWDADGGYAKMIREAREAAGNNDETAAEAIFLKRLSKMATRRYLRDKEERERQEQEEKEEERKRELARQESEEAERRRKMKGKAMAEEESEEAERRRKNKGKVTAEKESEEEERQRKEEEKAMAEEELEVAERWRENKRKATAAFAKEELEEAERRRKNKLKAKAEKGQGREAAKKNRAKGNQPKGGKIDFAALGLDPPPRGFGELILQRNDGVRDVKLVIMKTLFATDLSKRNNRFSIPAKQVIDDFLTAEEFILLHGHPLAEIPTTLIGPTDDVATDVMLKKWVPKGHHPITYVLKKGWFSLVSKFPKVFKENAIVQLWSFRTAAGELRFQIHKIGQPDEEIAGRRISCAVLELDSSETETDEDDTSPPVPRRRLMPPPI